jgi:hypothetical protein
LIQIIREALSVKIKQLLITELQMQGFSLKDMTVQAMTEEMKN